MAKINAVSEALFGKGVTAAFNPQNGMVVVGEDIDAKAELVSSNWRTAESYIDKNAPLAGKAGLDDLERKGLIRKLNATDVENLKKYFTKVENDGNKTKMVGFGEDRNPSMALGGNIFLVLKKFQMPAGLFGAHSAIFYIPENVPMPEGQPGHSTVVNLKEKTCLGHSCPPGFIRSGN